MKIKNVFSDKIMLYYVKTAGWELEKMYPMWLFHVLAYNALSSSSDALKNKDKSNRYVCADDCKELHL